MQLKALFTVFADQLSGKQGIKSRADALFFVPGVGKIIEELGKAQRGAGGIQKTQHHIFCLTAFFLVFLGVGRLFFRQ